MISTRVRLTVLRQTRQASSREEQALLPQSIHMTSHARVLLLQQLKSFKKKNHLYFLGQSYEYTKASMPFISRSLLILNDCWSFVFLFLVVCSPYVVLDGVVMSRLEAGVPSSGRKTPDWLTTRK